MSTDAKVRACGHLWAVGFNDMGRAGVVRDEVQQLGRVNHGLIVLDVAVAVRYRDGFFTLNGDPFLTAPTSPRSTLGQFLAGLVLGAPPLTSAAVGPMLAAVGATSAEVGISDSFVHEVESLIKPGTSALFVLDEVGNMEAVLAGIHGLGGTVLRTNVDCERARLIQSTLSATAEVSRPHAQFSGADTDARPRESAS